MNFWDQQFYFETNLDFEISIAEILNAHKYKYIKKFGSFSAQIS